MFRKGARAAEVPGTRSGRAFGYEPRAAERAIFNIVGRIIVHVGGISRANNVQGGNSREASSETCSVRRSVGFLKACRQIARVFRVFWCPSRIDGGMR